MLPYALVASVIATTLALPRAERPSISPSIGRRDAIAVTILLVIVIPLYCIGVYTIPWQVNTDEVAFMSVARGVMAETRPDIFGLSWYFGCPVAAFVFFGKVAQLLGGIDLYHVRLSQSILGVACVVAAYVLFRRFLPTMPALIAAGILGANHSLIAYSRMANWHGSSLFLEIAALICLAIGIQNRSKRFLFLAGISCGTAFYFYFPGRIIIALCMLILVAAWVAGIDERRLKPLISSAFLLMLGWGLVTAPIIIASAKAPPQSMQYQREQLLIYPEGRKAAQSWTNTKSERAAWIANASNGLRAFNAPIVDHGWLYANYNHGFADPATGILLWVGFLLVVSRLFRQLRARLTASGERWLSIGLGDTIALTGFLLLYLSLAFLVTKAPNYQRLLMLLPFLAYFTGVGLWWLLGGALSALSSRIIALRNQHLLPASASMTVIGIFVANALIFGDFVTVGRTNGHEVGSTGRFVEARKAERGHTWILAADKEHLYYWWGEPVWWQGWLGFFAAVPDQKVRVVPVAALDTLRTPGPSTVFIARPFWEQKEGSFRVANLVKGVTNILPDGRLVAVEVSGGRQ